MKLHLLSWEVITRPKPHGDLGIQKVELKNKAWHSGLAWRLFHKPDSLCANTLIAKYYVQRGTLRKPNSRTWQCILEGWDICNKASRWVVNNGNRVSFLINSWIPNIGSIDSIICGLKQLGEQNLKVLSMFINGNWSFNSFSFPLPDQLSTTITYFIANISPMKEDKLF